MRFALCIVACSIPLSSVGICHARADAGGDKKPYVIVTDVGGPDDAYTAVVRELGELRHPDKILNIDPGGLDAAIAELRVIKPAYVALIVHPERIEDNFVGAVFEGLSKLDDDPYLDVACGYITGNTADDALVLVRNTAWAEANRNQIRKKFVGVAHTFLGGDLGPFATEQGKLFASRGYETAAINPIDDDPKWKENAATELKKLNGASLVYFAGHGMGNMSCAIPGGDLANITLDHAIVLNGTCHSAVTMTRRDATDFKWTLKSVGINPTQSVCLSLIHAGAIGQFGSTASSSWQNVASTEQGFLDEGRTLGEALQKAQNDQIRNAGVNSIKILAFEDGKPSPQALGPDQDRVILQSISRVILIGDPAYRPFPLNAPREVAALKPGPLPAQAANRTPVGELIRQMREADRPGFVALNQIIRIGKDAVPELIQELPSTRDWQVAKALGAIGDPRAIEALINKLESDSWSPMREVVVEALELLTSQKLGAAASDWRSWLNNTKE